MNFFEQRSDSFYIDGPAGTIEAILDGVPKGARGVAIVCHPHPLFDGTMHNKVAHTLARAYRDVGIAAIRFNFRGVGQSEGVHGDGIGEIEDLRAVYHFVKEKSDGLPIYLAGFSFGSMVAANGAAFVNPVHLTVVGPPIERYPYPTAFKSPVLLIQGTEDEVCSPEAAFAWGAKVAPTADIERFEGGSHFFHGLLIDLKKRLIVHLDNTLQGHP